MGFAVWLDTTEDIVWAQGTHEYRPMGAAVTGLHGQFRERDFSPRRRCPSRLDRSFVGHFGSLVDLNAFLRKQRKLRCRSTPPHL